MVTFLHRLTLCVLALLASSSPAGAAEVARIDGAGLDVTDRRGGDLCVELTRESRSGLRSAGTCGRAPWRPLRSMLVTAGAGDGAAAGGAVPAEITRGEAELADGRRVAFETLPGERYQGRHAGRLRFYLVALPAVRPRDPDANGVVAVRFFDAAGTLRGIAGAQPPGAVVAPRVTLLRQHVPGRTVTVSAQTRRTVASTPLALERFEESTCLMLRDRSGETTGCRDTTPYQPVLDLQPEHGCGGVRSTLYGFTADDVTAVRLKLGSGRTKLVRTQVVRGALGREYRVLATLLPRGEAVRSARAVGHAGRIDLGLRPGGLPCVRNDGTGSFGVYAPLRGDGPALPGTAQVVAERGGHRLLAADGAEERLCVGLDRLIADGGDCRLPPLVADGLYAGGADGLAWVLLPAEVARVRLPGGREVTPTAGGYTGRYAGTVRFLLVRVANGKRMTMLDAGGAVIGRLPVFGEELPRPDERPQRAARGRGWRLTAIGAGRVTCLGMTLRGETPGCEAFAFGEDGAYAAVGCSPRLAVLFGPLARSTRSVRATLAGGRTLRARIVRIPRSTRGGRAFVLALPRGALVAELRLGDRRTPFPVLPARSQCGYRIAEPFLGFGDESRAISARAWPGTARPRGSWSSR